jgi:hypothetical protein
LQTALEIEEKGSPQRLIADHDFRATRLRRIEDMTRALFMIATAILATCIFPARETRGHPAWGIAVDRQGQVYFSDLESIWKIDAQGRLSAFRAGGSGRHTHDLNIDEAGNLYGADNSYEPTTQRFFSAIWKMTPAGDFSYLLAPTDRPPIGTSIWRDRDGNMYHVTNYPERELLVLKRSRNGDVSVLAGRSNAPREYRQGVPYSVGGMALGTDGTVYFTHGANVSNVKMSGAITPLARNLLLENASGHRAGGGSPTQLFGIAVDAQGTAFVADYGNRSVLKIKPDGQTTTLIRAEESWFPTGVALRRDELYILETGHTPSYKPTGTRVRKLSPDGRVTVLATVGENNNPPGASAPPSVGESSSGVSSERKDEFQLSLLYVVLGAGAGLLASTIIVWRIRRRMA